MEDKKVNIMSIELIFVIVINILSVAVLILAINNIRWFNKLNKRTLKLKKALKEYDQPTRARTIK